MSVVQGPDFHAGQHFNENSPRPPVPGEERDRVGTCSPTQTFTYSSTWGAIYNKHIKGSGSPVLTPRRSSLPAGYHTASLADSNAPLGFEPEGSCEGGEASGRHREVRHQGSCSPPPYLLWASNLHCLLNDSDGVQLFRRFLEQESQRHVDTLDFWFACKGLKTHCDPEKVTQLVKVIYRRFLLRPQIAISDDLRKEVTRQIKEGRESLPQSVFDGVQHEVETLINETIYPNFLKSELYLQHVHSMQSGPCAESGSSSSSSSSRELRSATSNPVLPTVPEDAELPPTQTIVVPVASQGAPNDPAPRLTRDMLMATQERRAAELRPKPEAYAGVYLQRPFNSPYLTQPTFMAYNSYNPVSRQDSELQSLSSDARTDCDNISLTDRSLDGTSAIGLPFPTRRQHARSCKQIKEYASLNHDPYMHQTVIPRTQRMQAEQAHPMKPEIFAAILKQKLESVLRQKDAQEKLDRKLQENELHGDDSSLAEAAMAPRTLATTFREKLLVEDDSDQAILDQHVSRVWSDLTPSRSPGFDSPRPKSPQMKRRGLGCQSALPASAKAHVQGAAGYPVRSSHSRHTRKDKDVFSTFSSDSGNVHDYPDSEHKHHVPKSKSVPDHADALWQGRRPSSSRKVLTDQTDSGVSVLSDTPPVVASPQYKESAKVLLWLKENVKEQPSSSSGSWHAPTERESKHRMRMSSTTSPSTSRHSRKPGVGHHTGSRSGSLERCLSAAATAGPAQPFVADPSMPPLPLPHTATQLEEARRRLMDEDITLKKQRHGVGVKAEPPLSNPSTVRRPNRIPPARMAVSSGPAMASGGAPAPPGPSELSSQGPATVVVFSFCEEQVPYRTKIPGRPVTLRQFKEILPKKGTYRYFFKTECEEVDTKVIQEEITDDNEVLPLWEDKINAQVKPVE